MHKEGKKVTVFVQFNKGIHDKFIELSKLGIEIFFIPIDEKNNFLKKVYNKFYRWVNGYGNTPQSFFITLNKLRKISPTHFLINQGGTFNFIDDGLLLFIMKELSSQYLLISQHNLEYFTYPNNYRIKIKDYLSLISKFIFVSKRNYEVAIRQLASPINSEVYVVQNPCKIKLDYHLDYPNTDLIKVAFIGRLENKNKGLDILIDALANYCFKDFSWKLEIWGEGPDKEYLVELVHFHNLSDNISFKGSTNNVVGVWKENQMLLLPSHNEGSPLVILEAMMCSRASFATDVGDISEYVKDNVNGFIIPSATKNLIIENLYEAFLQHESWEALGKNAYNGLKESFDENPEESLLQIIFE